MATPVIQSLGSFSLGRSTQSAGTAIVIGIPPYPGVGTGVGNAGLPGGQAAKKRPLMGVPHITSLILDAGSTAHTLYIMRPKNYTWFSAAAAASQAVVSLAADPGSYSTAFNYPLPNGQTVPHTANDLIGSGDYCMYQNADGSWTVDTAAGSYSSGQVTMTTNLVTGGILAGGLFYYFGVFGDTDPNTGNPHLGFDTTTSARLSYTDPNGLWQALHAGDPLLVFDANATAADTFQLISGYYAGR